MPEQLSVPDLGEDDDPIRAALKYAAAGWYVLPVNRATKHAGSVLGAGWPAKTSRDPEDIAAWFAGTSHSLALHVGRSGAIAFDVDHPEHIPDPLAAAIAATHPPYQSTRANQPGRGHYLYATPPGRVLGNGTGGLGKGWGDVRGRNGIIIAAPSLHEKADQGARYLWERTGTLPVLPDEVGGLLRDAGDTSDAATDAQVQAFLEQHTANARPELLAGILGQFTTSVAGGAARHEALVLATSSAVREAAAGMYPAREAAQQLLAAFTQAMAASRDGVERTRGPVGARSEFAGVLAWAIGQLTETAIDTTRRSIAERMPRDDDSLNQLIAPAPADTPSIEQADDNEQDSDDDLCALIAHQDGESATEAPQARPQVKTPEGYRYGPAGVFCRRATKDGEAWSKIAYGPLVISATYEDPHGEQSVELAWTSRGRTVTRITARDVTRRGRELVKQLGSAGLPALEGDARAVERWLAEFEAANRGLIPHHKLARWLGWQPDGTFLASPDSGTKLEVVYDDQRAPARAHHAAGTFDGWQAAIKNLEGYAVPRIVVAGGLAPVLLKPLGLGSFALDVSSRSTRGKTTGLQCGISPWANPSEQADAMANWRTTLLAIEKRLNLVRGLPVVLDETMAAATESLIDQVLYQLPMGHGKARSGGWPSMLPWETIVLSSGERPALSYTTAQGASARVLSTTTAPFGNDGAAAVAAREGVLANYGHAGPRFAELVSEHTATRDGHDKLRAFHAVLRETFKGDTDMTARRAPMVAVLAMAERLACKAGILPYEALPDETWRTLFTTAHNPADDRPEQAMDVVREAIASRATELWPGESDRPPLRGWIGAVKAVDGEARVALLQQKLREILAAAGYSLDAVVDGWVDAGYLDVRPSQRPPYLVPVRFDGRVAKCLSFTAEALAVTEDAS